MLLLKPNLYSYKTDQYSIIASRYRITRRRPFYPCTSVYMIDNSCQTFPDFWNVGHVIDTDCCYYNVKDIVVTLYVMDAHDVSVV